MTENRFAGLTRSAIAIRSTRATSRGSRASRWCGVCHQPITGVTQLRRGRMNSAGSVEMISTDAGCIPTSSWASRSAAAIGPLSVDSSWPPGKATCAACERIECARSVSTISMFAGSCGSPVVCGAGPKSISTDALRCGCGGGVNCVNQAGFSVVIWMLARVSQVGICGVLAVWDTALCACGG